MAGSVPDMSGAEPCLLLLTADPVASRGARKAARAGGLTVLTRADPTPGSPAVIVVDLEQPGAIDEISALRVQNADAILVGHVSMPDKERWVQAERAGCDMVANRGALGRQLTKTLADHTGRRRFPLLDEADVSGRLGLVTRVEETPFGPLAVYQVGGRVTVIDDVCPHAGAQLSAGEVEGCVVTCPRHGSQFDVQTGERLRGPADEAVAAHEVLREAARVQLVWVD